MSTNPNLITLLKKASTINLEVTNSTNFIFTQPQRAGERSDFKKNKKDIMLFQLLIYFII